MEKEIQGSYAKTGQAKYIHIEVEWKVNQGGSAKKQKEWKDVLETLWKGRETVDCQKYGRPAVCLEEDQHFCTFGASSFTQAKCEVKKVLKKKVYLSSWYSVLPNTQ